MIFQANPCSRCGAQAELKTVQVAHGFRLFYACHYCPPPIEGHTLRASAFEATADWNERNEGGSVDIKGNGGEGSAQKADSPLMKAAIRDARFLVTLKEGSPETDNYVEIAKFLQRMIDDGTAELFLGLTYIMDIADYVDILSEKEVQ